MTGAEGEGGLCRSVCGQNSLDGVDDPGTQLANVRLHVIDARG